MHNMLMTMNEQKQENQRKLKTTKNNRNNKRECRPGAMARPVGMQEEIGAKDTILQYIIRHNI